MFIAKQDNLIVSAANTQAELEEKVKGLKNVQIEETNIQYEFYLGDYIPADQVSEKEKESVAKLKMTPRDFLLSVINLGATWKGIKQLMDTNAQVAIELQFCNHVYRGNPLLDQFCEQFGISTEQLDTLFKNKGF